MFDFNLTAMKIWQSNLCCLYQDKNQGTETGPHAIMKYVLLTLAAFTSLLPVCCVMSSCIPLQAH